jgi:phospholipid/cholesterol/gamma-HCH transport system permease protein
VTGWFNRREGAAGGVLVEAGGHWDVTSVGRLDAELRGLRAGPGAAVVIDLGGVERLDTAGAWLLHRMLGDLAAAGARPEIVQAKPDHRIMLEQVAANDRPCEIEPPAVNPLLQILARLGEGTVDALEEGAQVLSFFGHVIVALGRTLLRPGRLRFTSLVHHMEDVGLNALPIVGLISLLIGVVLAYQGASTLKQFGAEIFVVNLIGISILREIGILLTAVVVAGRSGSAFAAAIGSMVIREEVDAMRTLGLDPMEVLVLPRLLALVLTLPMLAFFADMMGLLGGAAMAWIVLDVSPAAFVSRLNDAIVLWTFWTGIIKAPFFGFLIGMIGCLEGMRVRGSAESVGRQTTRAVVTSLFLVIVVDALFSIFYSTVGI